VSKIEDAKNILYAFGLSKKQQNDRSARVLLSLANIKEKDSRKNASNNTIGIHEMITFIADKYHFQYAENSRESIRRQSIHQFEQAGIIIRNADNPSRPTNSGKTVYSIIPEALKVIKTYKSTKWEKELSDFKSNINSLIKKYEKIRKSHLTTIKINNKEYKFSPGKHNILQKKILDIFAPRFAHDTVVVYIGDTAHKRLYLDEEICKTLFIDITQHDKLPDVVLYNSQKEWLYLIEAVTSHGPISFKRVIELNEMLRKSRTQKIFVSAFPDFKTFIKYAPEIAWETEVWISENPDHMIHFNGEKFLGPMKISK